MSKIFNISIGCDLAGVDLKNQLIEYFEKENNITDFGVNSKDSVDYPDIANKLCNDFSDKYNNPNNYGILICGSGMGMSIAANRFKHIRAALCHDETITKLAREHNNANILVLGARFIDVDNAINLTNIFLQTDFIGKRHAKRVDKLS